MGIKQGILGAALALLIAAPALASDLEAEIEEIGTQIDEQYTEWTTADRTAILSLYFRALTAHEEGDEEAAAEALAEVKEKMGI